MCNGLLQTQGHVEEAAPQHLPNLAFERALGVEHVLQLQQFHN